MPWKLTLLLLSTISAFLWLPRRATAQTTISGALMGTVADPSGAAVPGAVVELLDKNKGSTQASIADRDGTYGFNFLPPGRYLLTVSHTGFRNQICDVDVRLGPPGSANVTLEMAASLTTVKVLGEAPLIHAENGDVSTTMSQLQSSEVPNPGNDLTYTFEGRIQPPFSYVFWDKLGQIRERLSSCPL